MPSPSHPGERTEIRVHGRAARRIRELQGKSQVLVAAEVGVLGAWLSKVEAGQLQPPFPKVQRLAQALRVDVEDITYLTRVAPVAPVSDQFEDVA